MNTNPFKQFTMILSMLFLIPIINYAQEQSEITKDFEFTKSSKTQTIDFDVASGVDNLLMEFEGKLTKGSMKIKIIDPEGNVITGFSLVCSNEGGNANVFGNANSSGDVSTSSTSISSSGSSSSSSSSSSAKSTVSTQSSNEKKKMSKSKRNKETGYNTFQTIESDETGARGVMNKIIENPQPGKWKYSIITDDASGELSAKIRLN
jgi:hypothetical protein